MWPSGGWRRASRYLAMRLSRIPGTPYSLAAGFSWGAFTSFLPFPGLHFIMAAIFALATRANVLAAAIGTVVGNPWTFPFIWVGTYELGAWLGFGAEGVNFADTWGRAFEAGIDGRFGTFLETAQPLLLAMTVGGSVLGAVAWGAFFIMLAPLVRAYQRRRRGRIARARAGDVEA
ncbi:MAG: DUF2062 domain-containing protein [Alphaproteobacteria bacterium]|nr:DUF2062 domain-containing protein [Alphaproteobacteria bacterium]